MTDILYPTMQILVTGGSGFIGKHLVAGLAKHNTILAPSHAELDLLDQQAVTEYIAQHKITVVIHSAVYSATAQTRDDGFAQDLRMTATIFRQIDQLEKIIFFGSGAEFGKTRDMQKIAEDVWGQVIPQDSYGLTKYITHEIIRREAKIVNLRVFGVYGPEEDYRYKFISNAIVKNLLGLPITIKQDVLFDYLFVTDLVPVVEHFLTHRAKHRDYNVTPTDSITLSEIVRMINDVSEHTSPVAIVKEGLNFAYTGHNGRLLKEIPDLTFTSYKNGIIQLMSHYKKILPTLDTAAIQKDEFLLHAVTKTG